MHEKLIVPAYERFVSVVYEGRQPHLSLDDAVRLADGSIYSAQEALNEDLIDQIGYLDTAVEKAESLAGISNSQVVRYRKVVNIYELIQTRFDTSLSFTRSRLLELTTPEPMYLWREF